MLKILADHLAALPSKKGNKALPIVTAAFERISAAFEQDTLDVAETVSNEQAKRLADSWGTLLSIDNPDVSIVSPAEAMPNTDWSDGKKRLALYNLVTHDLVDDQICLETLLEDALMPLQEKLEQPQGDMPPLIDCLEISWSLTNDDAEEDGEDVAEKPMILESCLVGTPWASYEPPPLSIDDDRDEEEDGVLAHTESYPYTNCFNALNALMAVLSMAVMADNAELARRATACLDCCLDGLWVFDAFRTEEGAVAFAVIQKQ